MTSRNTTLIGVKFIPNRPTVATSSTDIPEIFRCSYSPHIRLKFGEIRFINQRFITEKPRVESFLPKMSTEKNGTDVHYLHAKLGGDRFTHGDGRTKIRVFEFLFCLCHAGRGLFWSRRAAAMFGTLTKYSFAIYCSIITGLKAFLEAKT